MHLKESKMFSSQHTPHVVDGSSDPRWENSDPIGKSDPRWKTSGPRIGKRGASEPLPEIGGPE